MTSSQRMTWGIVLNVLGSILFVGGLAVSFTLVGACFGIPAALLGLPMIIWGAVWMYQARGEKQSEAIASGIREGLDVTRRRESPPPVPSALPAETEPPPSADER